MTDHSFVYIFSRQQRTPFIFDLDVLTVILVFTTLASAFLFIVPGIRGKLRIFWMSRVIISLFIGAVMVAVQFSSDWASARVKANTTYKSFSNTFINAEVGLHVGLSGINITLEGDPKLQQNETINYNEAFHWTDSLEDDYTEALERGLPNPILYIAEKFTLSSPCGLHSQYRFSAQYTSATMWTAFCCWLVANILFSMPVLLYAGCMTLATGALVLLSLVSFGSAHHLSSCMFSVGTASFHTSFSCSFWLALGTGVLCTVLGFVVVVMDCFFPKKTRELFSIAVDEDDDNSGPVWEGYLNDNFLVPTVPMDSLMFAASVYAGTGKTQDTFKHCI